MSAAEQENQLERSVSDFIRKWSASGSGERSNFQSFLNELCDLLAVPRPDPATSDDRDNAYVFERAVQFDDGDGRATTQFIDLYKRGCFVMEAKQGSVSDEGGPNLFDLDAAARGNHKRGTGAPPQAPSRGRLPCVVCTAAIRGTAAGFAVTCMHATRRSAIDSSARLYAVRTRHR